MGLKDVLHLLAYPPAETLNCACLAVLAVLPTGMQLKPEVFTRPGIETNGLGVGELLLPFIERRTIIAAPIKIRPDLNPIVYAQELERLLSVPQVVGVIMKEPSSQNPDAAHALTVSAHVYPQDGQHYVVDTMRRGFPIGTVDLGGLTEIFSRVQLNQAEPANLFLILKGPNWPE